MAYITDNKITQQKNEQSVIILMEEMTNYR